MNVRARLGDLVRLAGLIVCCSGVVRANTFTLNNGNSSALIESADLGMRSWTVDGQNQLYKQWFWYRVGSSGPESVLSALPLVSFNQATPGTLDLVYGNSQFNIELTFSMLGGLAGSGESDIGEQAKVTNLGHSRLSFHLFQYTDFDLGGTGANDTVQLGSDLQGLYDEAFQHKGNVDFADTVISPGANHGEVAIANQIYNDLSDSSPTTLNDFAGPITGDSTWAFQWDPTIASGGSFSVSIDKKVTIVNVPVPEPAAGTLAVFGLLSLAMSRRRGGARHS